MKYNSIKETGKSYKTEKTACSAAEKFLKKLDNNKGQWKFFLTKHKLDDKHKGRFVWNIEVKEKEENKELNNLDALALSINKAVDAKMTSTFTIGRCLTEAQTLHKEDKDNYPKNFLAWAEENCNIKKAMAYRYIKQYKLFGVVSEFKHLSTDLLHTLSCQEQEVIDIARGYAKDNQLDKDSLNEIIKSMEPVDTTPEPKVSKKSKKDQMIEDQNEQIKTLKSALSAKSVKGDTGIPGTDKSAADLELEALRDTIKSLTEQLERLRADQAKPASQNVPKMPYLPQFDSESMTVRLGIDASGISKKAVQRAYRALAGIFTAASNPKAAEAIREARESLLKDLA